MMKTRLAAVAAMVFLVMVGTAMAEKPLKDYSFIRGACYPGGWRNNEATIKRDLGYARRVGINSTRVWLSYRAYEKDPQELIQKIRNYIQTANSMGISTMVVLWNGNSLNPVTLAPSFRTKGDAYVKAVVEALKGEKGLLMWDVMNEPLMNDYYNHASPQEKPKRHAQITSFERHYIRYVKKLDPVDATTIGYAFPRHLGDTADLVDVLTFHDYLETRSEVEASYHTAEGFAEKYHKPVLNSEMGCIARANPYDMAIQICREHHMGFYVFQLMIEGYWSSIHGIFYPNGTIRNPTIVAALLGFYRNRDLRTMVMPQPNREGRASKALKELQAALQGETSVFGYKGSSTDAILEAAERCANFLEAAQMVPMDDPPTAKIQYWRSLPENERDKAAIRAFAYQLGETLKKQCHLF